MIGSATLEEARVADVFNKWFGRTISNAILILVFKNDQVHPCGDSVLENCMQHKKPVTQRKNTMRVIHRGESRMTVHDSVVVATNNSHDAAQNGRAHVVPTVTTAQIACCLLLET